MWYPFKYWRRKRSFNAAKQEAIARREAYGTRNYVFLLKGKFRCLSHREIGDMFNRGAFGKNTKLKDVRSLAVFKTF